ncbi:O-antigen ligase family protein [Halomonas sp. M4R1S46]|uniref:O-antigen ligase family protein n=1 Tax=Halomonas sp. M4R1S46 TaxID=2982692 RepID=UPI0021E3F770|nr:O-antigen ligase family protein [Halomonas sp. M4R1S46]UYG06226.1 O-antigen ligase family protein [Halomonas sp. M4R1S46]
MTTDREPPGRAVDVWGAANTLLIWAFVALLILMPWAYAAVPLAAGLLALAGLLLQGAPAGDSEAVLDAEDRLWLVTLLAFAGLWCWDVARTGVWPVAGHGGSWLVPLWPVLAAGLLVWLRYHPPSRTGWWLGLVVGALGAGCIAVYERFALGADRADNGMNAIPFGNLALLLGVLALVAMLGRLAHQNRVLPWLTVALGLAAVGGFAASFLSGTRGGWVALPLLVCMGFRGFHGVFPHRWMLAAAAGVLLLLAVLVAMTTITGDGVHERIVEAVSGIERYLGGDSGNSVGLRLDMWSAGIQLFLEKPLAGWGEGRLQAAWDGMVEAGLVHSAMNRFDQLHSDLIDTAARRGGLGLLSLLALYGVPVWLFARHLRGSQDAENRTLALSGLMICFAFVIFGLTQSMLRDARGLSGYLGLTVACWVLLKTKFLTKDLSRDAGAREDHEVFDHRP